MEDINRIKVVLVEKKKTNKWLAQEMGKKIIAIQPWAAQRTSQVVKNAADEIVGWNTSSIVNAIRGY